MREVVGVLGAFYKRVWNVVEYGVGFKELELREECVIHEMLQVDVCLLAEDKQDARIPDISCRVCVAAGMKIFYSFDHQAFIA